MTISATKPKQDVNLWRWNQAYRDYTKEKPEGYDHKKVVDEMDKELARLTKSLGFRSTLLADHADRAIQNSPRGENGDTMTKGTFFVLSVILLAAMQIPYWANAEEEPSGLLMRKGLIKWGVSQAEARKATEDVSSLRFSCGAEDPTGVVSCTWACCVDLGEETTKYFATLWFHHLRFFKYEVTFSPKKFPSLVEAFEKRLGAPEKNEHSTIQNRMGTTFDQEERQWRTKNTEVQIAKRGGHGKFDTGYFVVIYAPIMSEIKGNNPAKTPF